MNAPLPKTAQSGCGCSGGTASPACGCGGAGCEACKGQVYVRPRFFAGQLLTEDDLQTLTDYVANKNRLHNRALMGAGVACGFEVTCHPCGGGSVVVNPGYALDCCGNDIVLQCPVELDVNAMVRSLRRDILGGYDCGDPCPPQKAPKKDAKAEIEAERDKTIVPAGEARRYCLYVRYCEEATEPVTPYAADEPCGAATCEPSRIREGLRFELRCQEQPKLPDGFIFRLLKCIGDLVGAEWLALTMAAITNDPAADKLAQAKQVLLAQLDRTPGLTDCALRGYVSAIALPPAGTAEAAAEKLQYAWGRLLRDCICRAINPPCAPCEDPGVLLACLEVSDCEVIDICNLERSYVFTAVAFRYWVPIFLLGEALERACCAKLEPEDKAEKKGGAQELVSTTKPRTADKGSDASPGGGTNAPAEADAQAAAVWPLVSELGVPMLDSVGLGLEDAMRLRTIVGSLGKVANQGTFDRIAPFSRIASAVVPRKSISETAADEIRTNDAIRKAVDTIVAERVAKDIEAAKAGSSREILAEVDKRVKDALPAAQLKTFTDSAKEVQSLKKKYETLETKYKALEARIAKAGGDK